MSTPRLLTLQWSAWAVLMCSLGAILVVTDIVLPSNPVRALYWVNIVGKQQEERFGFRARYSDDLWCIEIAEVLPGGAFERAGVQPGWVPRAESCLGYSPAEVFYSGLTSLRPGWTRDLYFYRGGCGEWTRQAAEGPVRVSVTASDPDLRSRSLGSPRALD